MAEQYTTSRGKTVTFLSIAMLLAKFQEAHQIPTPPTYEVTTLGGGKEIHYHNADTVRTPDEKQAYADYLTQIDTAQSDNARHLMNLIFMRGIAVEIPNDDWEREHRLMGLRVPSDPLERRLHYIETEVMGGLDDYQQIVIGVLETSGVSDQKIAEVQSFFRRDVGGDSTARPSHQAGQVENRKTVRADARRRPRRHRKDQ